MADKKKDFLGRMVAHHTAKDPEFPAYFEEAVERRRLLRELAECRGAKGLSQTAVAADMGTSQSSVARLETSATDALLSTVERFAAAVGMRVEIRLVEADPAEGKNKGSRRALSGSR